jgi:serine/threonine protein kinase/TPR repeat protein
MQTCGSGRNARERTSSRRTRMNIQNLYLNCFAERRPESPCEQCGWREKSAADVDGQLTPGSVLHNRYVIGQPLGRGGFSITYRGWDSRLHRLRAVKEYFPAGVVTRDGSQSRVSIVSGQGGLYSDGIQKYLAEARFLARFEGHPCIVFPTDFFEENATAYLVMEYLQGETLRQYVTRHGGRIPYEHAVYFLTPVLRALATVHQAGMLHRDVSPDNVFLTVDNETKLLDFGAARQRLGGQSAAMTVIIRDHYAPPEQYSETGSQGSWTDIYAFAATFYYALTGESPPSALSRLMNDEIRRPSELGVTLPIGAEGMLMRSLAIQPKERPQRIEEVMHALLAPPQPIEPAVVEAEPVSTLVPIAEPPVQPVVLPLVSPPIEAPPAVVDAALDFEQEPSGPFAAAARELAELWHWGVLAVAALVVAFGTYWTLERLSGTARASSVPPVSAGLASSGAGAAPGSATPVSPDPSPPPVAPPVPPVVVPPPTPPVQPVAPPDVASNTAPPPRAPRQDSAVPTPPAVKPPTPPPVASLDPATTTAPRTKPDADNLRAFNEGRELVSSKVRADRKRGYELVAYAANQGLPEAEELLGSLYVEGIADIQKPDDDAALGWYRKAAKHGRPKARYALARRLELGEWENKVEFVEPCKWYVPFCRADLPNAQIKITVDPEADLLAWLRSQSPGKGSRAELKEALGLYQELAKQGRTDAQERIGYMLVAGNGIEPNRYEAFLWFLRAARNGNPSAQYVVGKMYAKGEGWGVSESAAECWLRKAAASKVGPARRALVTMGKAKADGELEPAPAECRFKPFED